MAGADATIGGTGARTPGLRVILAGSLGETVDTVVAHLTDTAGRDLFATDNVIVPNAGVRAWLLQQVAGRLGASDGGGDGVVALVEVGYLGMLDRLLLGGRTGEDDPWSIDAMTMVILRRLNASSAYSALVTRHGGRALRAARVMADRFDAYHARRPRMIEEWEAGHAVLVPEIGDRVGDGEWLRVSRDLAASDRWQYDLWREVREEIPVPPPPVRVSEAVARLERGDVTALPDRLVVVGLQSVPAHHLRVLGALAAHVPVTVHLIHPSPALAGVWDAEARRFSGAHEAIDARLVGDDAVADDFASVWLRGSRDMQILLAAHGIAPELPAVGAADAGAADDLLGRVKGRVATPSHEPTAALPALPRDRSVSIHRGHTLARQVEILHDALIHAFTDLGDLEPHEVVILCPDMAAAAPHLDAVFDRDVPVLVPTPRGAAPVEGSVRIPLVVADRGLREVSEAALVLSHLLKVLTGRVSRSDLLGLFDHESVLRGAGMGADVLEFWDRLLEASGMRWGLSDAHRGRHGLAVDLADAHTWVSTLRQSLLGALVPDASPAHEMNGVPALVDLDTADVPAVAALVRLVGVVMEAEHATHEPSTVVAWCDLVERTLVELCGESADLESVTSELARLRRATVVAGESAAEKVPFEDFAPILEELISAIPGRQPLRTGAVTATSMLPLRSVPFRVVCVLGYDDAAVSVSDAEGDDLRGRQRLVGDADPRIEARRTFLDAVLAAGERLIVTCTGRNAQNNKPVPFTTSLAEFVDFCVAAGGERGKNEEGEDTWSFVHDHPRHPFSERNFVRDGDGDASPVVPSDGRPWSHDLGARKAAEQVAGASASSSLDRIPVLAGVEPRTVFTLDDLVKVVTYPIDFYFRSIGVDKWDDILAETPDEAVIPMDAEESVLRRLILEWGSIVDGTAAPDRAAWERSVRQRGLVPVGEVGRLVLSTVVADVAATRQLLITHGFASTAPVEARLGVTLPSGRRLEQTMVRPESNGVGAYIACIHKDSDKDRARLDASLELLIRRAAGEASDTAAVVTTDSKGAFAIYRVHLDGSIDDAEATDRLEALLDAIEAARRAPAAPFQKAGWNIASTEDASMPGHLEVTRDLIDEYVGSEKYSVSSEALFYGETPDAEMLCSAESPWRAVWRHLGRASGWSGRLKPSYSGTKKTLPGSTETITGYVLK